MFNHFKTKIVAFLFLMALCLAFQNCSAPLGKIEGTTSNSLVEGNGDGYTGFQIQAPTYAVAGEKIEVQVLGGSAPYKLKVSGSELVIRETENAFTIEIPPTFSEASFEISASDSSGSTAIKTVWITKVHVDILDGKYPYLGESMAMGDDLITISGRNGLDPILNQGAIFTFKYSGPNHLDSSGTLFTMDDSDYRARAMSMHDGFLITGDEWRNDSSGNNTGGATLYKWTGKQWNKTQALLPESLDVNLKFGSSLSLDKKQFVIGSRPHTLYGGFTAAGVPLGRIHIYRLSTKGDAVLDQVIYDPHKAYYFGYKSKMKDGLLFVSGLDKVEQPYINPGYVDVFKKGDAGWTMSTQIRSPNNGFGKNACGQALDYSEGLLVIGCPDEFGIGQNVSSSLGSVNIYIEEKGEWKLIQQLIGIEGETKMGKVLSLDKGLLTVVSTETWLEGSYTIRGNMIRIYKFNSLKQKFELIKVLNRRGFNNVELFDNVAVRGGRVLFSAFKNLQTFIYIMDFQN